MNNRRRLFVLASISLVSGVVAAVACSFPEPAIIGDDGGTTTTDGNVSDTSSGGTDGEVTDGGKFADVVEPDAPPPVDANGEKPVIDTDGCACDCDKDGYRSKDQDAAACDGSARDAATPIDCDDLEPRAHPNAGFVKDVPTQPTNGDWNCDNAVTREIPAVNVNCADYSGLNILGCNGVEGFANDPGCAETASYIQCKANGTTCSATNNTQVKQGCK